MSVKQFTVSGAVVDDIVCVFASKYSLDKDDVYNTLSGVNGMVCVSKPVAKQAMAKKTIWCLLPSCNESAEHYFTTVAELTAHTSEHHPDVCQGKRQLKEKKKHHKASTKFYQANRLAGKTWTCGVCEKVFNKYSKNNKRHHLETHLPECERTYECQHQNCARRFPQKFAADAHYRNFHDGNSQHINAYQKYKKKEPTAEVAEKARCELKKL
jgi:hypothetical protein